MNEQPNSSSGGGVVQWALLGTLLYFGVGAASALLAVLVGSAGLSIFFASAPLAYFGVPIALYVLSLKDRSPEQAKGFGIGLALFFGLSFLLPIVICGGMLASNSFNVH